MDEKTVARKLVENEKARKRWMTRLTRAHNALKALEAQRGRLMRNRIINAKANMVEAVDKRLEELASPPAVETDHMSESEFAGFAQRQHSRGNQLVVEAARQIKDAGLDLPTFLKRGQDAQKAVDEVIAKHDPNQSAVKAMNERMAKRMAAKKKERPVKSRVLAKAIAANKALNKVGEKR